MANRDRLCIFRFAPNLSDGKSWRCTHRRCMRARLPRFSFATVEGLISMPSFHASLALVAVWSSRRHRAFCLGLAIVNAIMVVAAAMLGLHYVVDVLVSLVLFPIGLVIESALSGWQEPLTNQMK